MYFSKLLRSRSISTAESVAMWHLKIVIVQGAEGVRRWVSVSAGLAFLL